MLRDLERGREERVRVVRGRRMERVGLVGEDGVPEGLEELPGLRQEALGDGPDVAGEHLRGDVGPLVPHLLLPLPALRRADVRDADDVLEQPLKHARLLEKVDQLAVLRLALLQQVLLVQDVLERRIGLVQDRIYRRRRREAEFPLCSVDRNGKSV